MGIRTEAAFTSDSLRSTRKLHAFSCLRLAASSRVPFRGVSLVKVPY